MSVMCRLLLRRRLVAAALMAALAARTGAAMPLAQATGPALGRAVTDETHRHMTIPANVRRIVSLAPNLTEIVYSLGAGDRLVGDTTDCDTPAEAKQKPHVGGSQRPSLEAVVALRPDLVLASGSINSAQTADALLKAGVPVYTTYPKTVRDMLRSIGEISDLIGAKTQGDALEASLEARLGALEARLADRPPAHVLFLLGLDPAYSIGTNTFIADGLRWAGAESILVTDQNYPQPAFEEVLRIQPDYIVLAADHDGMGVDAAELRSRADWKDLMAVKTGRVVTVSDAIERPAPGMVDAIEQLARELHPEAFLTEAAH
jgi:iron complex transport system substrate-binding protein